MNKKIIILAAGIPHKGLESSLLMSVNGQTVLDWQLSVFRASADNVQLVLGYESSSLDASHNRFKTVLNDKWNETGSAYSLLQADLSGTNELWVSYGDILYHDQTITKMDSIDSSIVIAWDSLWRTRYLGREHNNIVDSEKVIVNDEIVQRLGADVPDSWASGEFVGLVKISGSALEKLRLIQQDNQSELTNLNLSALIEMIRTNGHCTAGYDVQGDWAELNEPRDLAHFILGTKAETLSRLRGVVQHAVIQDQVSFTVENWNENSSELMEKVLSKFKQQRLVVRSSAKSEDSFTHSNAGAYESLLNVDPISGLSAAVDNVINSYQNCQNNDQVLIQPMVTDVIMSGVVFTRTLEQGSPYYVVNYEESGSTEGITSGTSCENRVLYLRKDSSNDVVADQRLVGLICAVKEIETLLSYDALDIEFALNSSNEVHVLQVRPIAIQQGDVDELYEAVITSTEGSRLDYCQMQLSNASIQGRKAIFGNMPDWNPAEIIGTNPGKMAYSLYRYLILDEVWAVQRAEYGYKDVRPHCLIKLFSGKPYIDVRASFNSFIPGCLSSELTERLVNFYTDWLMSHPQLHDKIEFDVLPTCLGLDFKRWKQRLGNEGGFSEDDLTELEAGLLEVTKCGIERIHRDLNEVHKLVDRFNAVQGQHLPSLYKIKVLLDDCKRFGTLPFAHLARSGFIAMTLLKEGVSTGSLSEEAKNSFLGSLRTVSHELTSDAFKVANDELSWTEFVDIYGHLRPGTYDITSEAYFEDPEHYLRPIVKESLCKKDGKGDLLWESEKFQFFDVIRSQGIQETDEALEFFLRASIEGREKAKFLFSKSLSWALNELIQWGERQGISRDNLSNLSINSIVDLDGENLSEEKIIQLKRDAEENSQQKKLSLSCQLPPLITKENDFCSFVLNESHPNFIGVNKVISSCINLENHKNESLDVKGKIVMIPQADPGFDWLFGQGIVGLITMYGGANSHMAIRSAEFGLPAAIGIGDTLYRRYAFSKTLELDPANSIIRVIH
ncbi:MAG: glutamine kinase [Thiomicrorhabdus sp.]|nr:MAG: glutamine kinase [Thiomicrorhabdus sp.]